MRLLIVAMVVLCGAVLSANASEWRGNRTGYSSGYATTQPAYQRQYRRVSPSQRTQMRVPSNRVRGNYLIAPQPYADTGGYLRQRHQWRRERRWNE